jgi:hypothetical protein
MTHTAEFRSLPNIEARDIFVSTAYIGQTHIAAQEDSHLSDTLKLYKRACSFGDFSREEIKKAMNTIAPFFIKSIQDRAIYSLSLRKYFSFIFVSSYVVCLFSFNNRKRGLSSFGGMYQKTLNQLIHFLIPFFFF